MRGVNKLIVEIKDTENEYFDRAILFLKPDKVTVEQSELNLGAEKLLSAVRNGRNRRKKRWIWFTAACGAAVLAGGAVAVVMMI